MDLRGFEIPKNIDAILREHKEKALIWYQPFVFSDTAIVGTGAAWNRGMGQYICTDADDAPTQRAFMAENIRLGHWYEQLISMVLACSPKSETFADLGCNVGHLSFQLAAAGRMPTGVDVWRECYEFVARIAGTEFEYIQARYDSARHIIPELEGRTFDFVIASAMQTHLSDPHFFMGYTDRIARDGMLYTTPIIEGEDPLLRLRITRGRRERPVPERFEFLPTASAMEIILQAMRPHVYRREHQPTDPKNIAKWGVWIALSEPISDEVARNHHLVPTQDRIEQFADRARGLISISTRSG
jgi:hypothetical protein